MNWDQFKDPVSHLCFPGTMVASWFLMQEMAGSSPFTGMANIFVTDLNLLNSEKTFRENSNKRINIT